MKKNILIGIVMVCLLAIFSVSAIASVWVLQENSPAGFTSECEWNSWTNVEYADDGDYDTSTDLDNQDTSGCFSHNFTATNPNPIGAKLQLKTGAGVSNYSLPTDCVGSDAKIQFNMDEYGTGDQNKLVGGCRNRTSESGNLGIFDGETIPYYEMAVWWEYSISLNGSGTEGDPYQITNCTDLQMANLDVSAFYILTQNIDCSDTINWNGGDGFNPIASSVVAWENSFTGTFDGDGYTISNLFVNRTDEDSVGLFAYLSTGTIKNVRLENETIIGLAHAGGLVGSMGNELGLIEKCGVSGSAVAVGGNTAGGMVGVKWDGTINNSYADVDVQGANYVSGFDCQLAGINQNSYAVGLVIGSGSPVGGFDACSGGSDPANFWDTETTGQNSSTGGLGKTTAEMKTQTTFTDSGWDFDTIWQMCSGEYPTLRIFGECPLVTCSVCNETCSPCGGGCTATDFSEMYYGVVDFDGTYGDITGWNTSCITCMNGMFTESHDFNQDISGWDTSNVNCEYGMDTMFGGEGTPMAFNQNLGSWNMSSILDVFDMFEDVTLSTENYDAILLGWSNQSVQYGLIFNGGNSQYTSAGKVGRDILTDTYGWTITDGGIVICSVCNETCSPCGGGCTATDMTEMYEGVSNFDATYGDITGWDTSCITGMSIMFPDSDFNQNISSWDTSSVVYMNNMFMNTPFDQDISGWNVSQVINMDSMFLGVTLSIANYDTLLLGWSSQIVKTNVEFHAGNSQYTSDGKVGRDILTDTYGWTITDGGLVCQPDWECSLFANCSANVSECLAVNDLNVCGVEFGGNLSDYDEECQENQTGYTPNFITGDITSLSLDVLGKGLLELIGLAGLVVVVVISITGINRLRRVIKK